jgi:hypothetical protein
MNSTRAWIATGPFDPPPNEVTDIIGNCKLPRFSTPRFAGSSRPTVYSSRPATVYTCSSRPVVSGISGIMNWVCFIIGLPILLTGPVSGRSARLGAIEIAAIHEVRNSSTVSVFFNARFSGMPAAGEADGKVGKGGTKLLRCYAPSRCRIQSTAL